MNGSDYSGPPLSAPIAGLDGPANFLQASFDYPNEVQELLLAISPDGKSWTDLFSGPVYTGPGGNTVRDPSIIYLNGTWYVAHSVSNGTPPDGTSPSYFNLISSTNLKDWTVVCTVDCSAAAGSSSGVAAPKWVNTNTSGNPKSFADLHIVFNVGGSQTCPIYEIHPTNASLTSWSGPSAAIGPVGWDPAVYWNGSEWNLFSTTTVSGTACVHQYTSSSPFSGYTFLQYPLGDTVAAEGSQIIPLGGATYLLLVDTTFNGGNFGDAAPTAGGNEWAVSTNSMASWSGLTPCGHDTPYYSHGGSVVLNTPIMQADVRTAALVKELTTGENILVNSLSVNGSTAVNAYHLNGDATDYEGDNNGAWYGTSNYVSSPVVGGGLGAQFSGTGSSYSGGDSGGDANYITLANQDYPIVSWACWIKVDTLSTAFQIYGSQNCGGWLLGLNSNGTVEVDAVCDYAYVVSNTAINDNDWHFIAFTYDGSTAKIYIDSDTPDNTNGSASYTVNSSGGSYYLGRGRDQPFDGAIAEFQIYNASLTSDQVGLIYNGGAGSYGIPAGVNDPVEIIDANGQLHFAEAPTTPTNTSTPAGWTSTMVDGVQSWMPYYQ